MPTAAVATHGAQLQMETATPNTYVKIAEVKDFSVGRTHRMEESTNHDSAGWSEQTPTGVADAAAISFTANWVSTQSHTDLRAAHVARTLKKFRVLPTTGTKRFAFSGYITELTEPQPVSGVRVINGTIMVTGSLVEEDIA